MSGNRGAFSDEPIFLLHIVIHSKNSKNFINFEKKTLIILYFNTTFFPIANKVKSFSEGGTVQDLPGMV